jgi:hypothetical protein
MVSLERPVALKLAAVEHSLSSSLTQLLARGAPVRDTLNGAPDVVFGDDGVPNAISIPPGYKLY